MSYMDCEAGGPDNCVRNAASTYRSTRGRPVEPEGQALETHRTHM